MAEEESAQRFRADPEPKVEPVGGTGSPVPMKPPAKESTAWRPTSARTVGRDAPRPEPARAGGRAGGGRAVLRFEKRETHVEEGERDACARVGEEHRLLGLERRPSPRDRAQACAAPARPAPTAARRGQAKRVPGEEAVANELRQAQAGAAAPSVRTGPASCPFGLSVPRRAPTREHGPALREREQEAPDRDEGSGPGHHAGNAESRGDGREVRS